MITNDFFDGFDVRRAHGSMLIQWEIDRVGLPRPRFDFCRETETAVVPSVYELEGRCEVALNQGAKPRQLFRMLQYDSDRKLTQKRPLAD